MQEAAIILEGIKEILWDDFIVVYKEANTGIKKIPLVNVFSPKIPPAEEYRYINGNLEAMIIYSEHDCSIEVYTYKVDVINTRASFPIHDPECISKVVKEIEERCERRQSFNS